MRFTNSFTSDNNLEQNSYPSGNKTEILYRQVLLIIMKGDDISCLQGLVVPAQE